MSEPNPEEDRRKFLITSSLVMGAGIIGGYGAFASTAVRYLYPAKSQPQGWMFVAEIARFQPGEAKVYRTPGGSPVAIARRGNTGKASDFVALSSTCPHLGCQVHWEGQNNRFFCPCHNGAFDPNGKAIAGPPAESKQSLPQFPLKIENGLLFIEVPMTA